MDVKVLTIGGSRNIGYHTSLKLLESGATVTFLLRNPDAFDNDEEVQKYVKSGKARLVKGDALSRDDCAKSWEEAAKSDSGGGGVDVLLFSLGGAPNLSGIRLVLDPPDLVTHGLLNVLSTRTSAVDTKVIVISALGVTQTSYTSVPFLLKPLYKYILSEVLKDKVGTERVAAYCGGWEWDDKNYPQLDPKVLGSDWTQTQGLPSEGALKDSIVIVRPAALTNGSSVAESNLKEKKKGVGYRVQEGDLASPWTISRKDVAHFLVEGVLKDWDNYKGKCFSVAY